MDWHKTFYTQWLCPSDFGDFSSCPSVLVFGMDIDVSLQMNDSGNLLTFTQGSGQVLWFMSKHFPFPSALAAHESGKHDTH